ncbi:unnamed protein product [Ostreobium quekettii]|uniref:Pyrrolidone-carboxylate peptidase n=1 Tax=Ostreobium quekettii TaxID=121088 RepID=A0A8S1IVM9_9CHLO|nr:unnamed protein product [Ostreobium quekettii]|eukprot:evm.model.scf_579.3 EVM.evm.TU.scf_579.3   scf_579:57589-61723(-)
MVVRFVVTGFGRFSGVASNPTEWLVDNLPEYTRGRQSGPNICAVLRVAASDVDKWLEATGERIKELYPEDVVVWLHLGVDPGGKCLAIEQQAINCATFINPDEDGCTFINRSIDESNGLSTDAHLCTDIDVKSLLDELQQRGFMATCSEDAGRFVCNWIYFKSLRQAMMAGNGKWHSLFIHVPYFSRVPEKVQMEFVSTVMDSIAEQLASRCDVSEVAA